LIPATPRKGAHNCRCPRRQRLDARESINPTADPKGSRRPHAHAESLRLSQRQAGDWLTPAYSSCMSDADEGGVLLDTRVAAAVVDVFVYVVVLNLFVEYFPKVLSETFTLSLLTAVLLKAVLEIVVVVKNRARARFRQAGTPAGKVVAGFLLWLVLFGSKFLVLEVVDLVFGSRVSLGGFIPVTLLIITLLLARTAVRRLLQRSRPPAHTRAR